jgi:hypothetical protein
MQIPQAIVRKKVRIIAHFFKLHFFDMVKIFIAAFFIILVFELFVFKMMDLFAKLLVK